LIDELFKAMKGHFSFRTPDFFLTGWTADTGQIAECMRLNDKGRRPGAADIVLQLSFNFAQKTVRRPLQALWQVIQRVAEYMFSNVTGHWGM
jgi:hypothetical protein